MERGHEEASTSQAGRRRGTPRKTPTASCLVAAMSVEEMRLYSQISVEISLEKSDGATTLTFGEADNVIYFTREPFLHFHWAPPTIIHLNVFWILMGCIVLNSFYHMDILLVEIYFIYTLKLGTRDRRFMSSHSPQL